jgi:hypothetical protein
MEHQDQLLVDGLVLVAAVVLILLLLLMCNQVVLVVAVLVDGTTVDLKDMVFQELQTLVAVAVELVVIITHPVKQMVKVDLVDLVL